MRDFVDTFVTAMVAKSLDAALLFDGLVGAAICGRGSQRG